MKLTPLAPAGQPGRAGPRWGFAGSALLHLAALALVLGVAARRPPEDSAGAPSFDLVFEGSAEAPPSGRTLPPSQPADVPAPEDAPVGPATPPPLAPPTPDPAGAANPEPAQLPPAPTVATAAPEPPAAAPSPATAPAPQTPPAQVAPAPSATVATSPPPELADTPLPVQQTTAPEVRLQLPPDSADARPDAMAEPIMPQPPPPLPPIAPRPQPRVAAGPRSAPGSLANPMNLSFNAAPPPATRGSRGIVLALPNGARGPSKSDPYAQIRAANASEDWNRSLLQYWLSHRYYPQQAAQNGDQGSVTIELTVNRYGSVENVRVLSPSGSQWLDMAAVGTFRGAHLRPFTDEMPQDKITFPVPITYYLVR